MLFKKSILAIQIQMQFASSSPDAVGGTILIDSSKAFEGPIETPFNKAVVPESDPSYPTSNPHNTQYSIRHCEMGIELI